MKVLKSADEMKYITIKAVEHNRKVMAAMNDIIGSIETSSSNGLTETKLRYIAIFEDSDIIDRLRDFGYIATIQIDGCIKYLHISWDV